MRTKSLSIALFVGLLLGSHAALLVHQTDVDTHAMHAFCHACIVYAIDDDASVDNAHPESNSSSTGSFHPATPTFGIATAIAPASARAPPPNS